MTVPLVTLKAITKLCRMGDVEVPALRRVSLAIEEGDFVAVMGASGSGKSTLMNIIGCLDRPTFGRYLLVGQDVSALARDELSDIRNRTLGFVFQSFNLLARTSVEVMALLQELGRSGITIVLVTHEPDIAQYASRVIVMRDGEVRSDSRQDAVRAWVPADQPVEAVS
jgi:ABC-type lipoprotein export system ATPase subunit